MMEGYSSEWVAHAGDEFVFVLSGQVRYTVGKQDYPLGPGDSLHFNAHERHRVVNVGSEPVELIAVGTLPLFGDGQPAFPSLPGEQKPPRTRAARNQAELPPAEPPSAQTAGRRKKAPVARAAATNDAARRAAKKPPR
ncbi:cupin domain protein [Burkholderia thailandensis E254]|nr:cupin domain protein [Burkholderia thailandensis E254]